MAENIKDNKNFGLLNTIDSPADLRKLQASQLPEVCHELRDFIINSLSTNPGHFASSMGAVEIVVALHYVFNTPYDRIVWDVGHQAYAHKILTGRRDKFCNNRKKDGLSGFPNPEESEYDAFIAGHASNSISAALGMAMASNLNHDEKQRNVVAVIGDASISGGMAFEGLNNAASNNNNLLIVLNDNDMAIDHNVGSLNEYMTHLNTSKHYNDLRYKVYKLCRKMHLINEDGKGRILRLNNSIKSFLNRQQNIFDGLNVRYFGPFDGNDINGLVQVLIDIKDMRGPRILHLRTRKGKGYSPAEIDPTTWHAPGKFDVQSGVPVSSGNKDNSPLKYQDVFGHTIIDLASKNDKIVGITAAMSTGTSLSMMIDKYPSRAFNVGISEEHAVTFAAGLAKEGLQPYCCIYSTFLQRGYDQIIHDVALQKLPVTFCIDRGGLVGEDGATHQGVFDLAYLRLIPNIIVSAPMNEHYLRNLLYTSQCENYGPFSIRYPRGKGVLVDWKNDMTKLEIGKGRKLRDGNTIVVLSIGAIGNNVAKAIDELSVDNISIGHYDMIFVKPLDESILEEVASRYGTVITVEDGVIAGGFGSAVLEWMSDNNKDIQIIRLGVPDKFIKQASVAEQYEMCGIDVESIKTTIKKHL